jgi:hypothetical protein
MGQQNKEVKIKGIHIPDGYVRVWLTDKKTLLNCLEDNGSYFNENGTLMALGDNIVFLYEETK